MTGRSPAGIVERLAQLRQLFPEATSEGRLDTDRLLALLAEAEALPPGGPEPYELRWGGKAAARREVQRQTTATLVPDRAGSLAWDATQHVFIEGENLEVLRVLQRGYFGKVQLIYIDPPYNTGNDSFVYPDDYSERRTEYEKRTGLRDEDGFLNKRDLWSANTKENGQYHSAWLSMMWPRLYLSRNLLREDGVIFVSIDDHEVHNLRLLLNEIFGEENFVAVLPTVMNLKGNNDEFAFAGTHEYTLVYCKNRQRAAFRQFVMEEEEFEEWQEDELGYFKKGATLKSSGEAATRADRPKMFYPILVDRHQLAVSTITEAEYARIYDPHTKRFDDQWVQHLRTHYTQAGFHFILPESGGSYGRWRWGWKPDLADRLRTEALASATKDGVSLYKKQRPGLGDLPTKKPKTLFYKPEYSSGNGTAQLKQVLGDRVFSNPKPVQLLKDFITLGADKDALILDFFAGSGTTAQAVWELNALDGGTRRFLLVQLPEALAPGTAAYQAGYRTIADIARARLRQVSQQQHAARAGQLALQGSAPDLGFRAYRLAPSHFREWRTDVAAADVLAQLELFQEPLRHADASDTAAVLTELLLKMTGGPDVLPLSVAVARRTLDGRDLHEVAPGVLWLALGGLNAAIVAAAVAERPQRLVVPGRCFGGDNPDEQVSNARLQLADAGVVLQLL